MMKKIFKSELTVGGSMQDHLQKLSEYFAELQDMDAVLEEGVASKCWR